MTAPVVPLDVLVVDDSPVQRRFLRAAVEADPAYRVCGEARDGREAVALVERLRPAVVLMDLDLPVLSGLEAIEQVMASTPVPILVYSAFVDGTASDNAVQALRAGAVDVLAKPGPGDTDSLETYAQALRARLRVAARIRVITHPRGRLRAAGAAPVEGVGLRRASASPPSPRTGAPTLVAVGASTGGPHALLTLLRDLPADLPQAVLVVQHMADGFLDGLASWLDSLVALPVAVAAGGAGRLLPGTVTLAPSGGNLLVTDERLRTVVAPPPPGQLHVPGIDPTFASIAEHVGPAAIGVLLTGMGRDGAAGLKAMRDRGAATLGQDEQSCVVYGMPAAASALGAVERELPLERLPGALLGLLGRRAA